MSRPSEQHSEPRRSKNLGTSFGLLALVIAIGAIAAWTQQIRAVAIPEDRTLFVLVFGSAVALGFGSFLAGTRWFGGMASVVAILLSSLVLLTISVSRQEVAVGAIAVGDVIPRFESVDEFGQPFDSATLHGHLLLIKFFRAHW